MNTLASPAAVPSSENDGPLWAALGNLVDGRDRKRLAQATATIALASTAWRRAKTAHQAYRNRTEWSVVVADHEAIYPLLHDWLLDQIPEHRRRAVSAHVNTSHGMSPSPVAYEDPAPETPARPTIRFRYDGSRSQTVVLDGHRVRVEVDREARSSGGPGSTGGYSIREEKVRLIASTAGGRRAIEVFLVDIAASLTSEKRLPGLRIASPWGEWRSRSDLPVRPLDTVKLADGQLEALMADLRGFLAAENDYVRLGVPWHRGYLLYGPPGTGKTSTVRAVATELGLDCYFMSLRDLRGNTQVISMMSAIPARSLLLLEDVDVLPATHDRADAPVADSEGVSLDGLLNALDGVVTPHGLITVLTTNHRDRLDPALIRPGRVDFELEIGPLQIDQLFDLWSVAFGDDPTLADLMADVTMGRARLRGDATAGDVVGILKTHLGDPAGAAQEIEASVTTTLTKELVR